MVDLEHQPLLSDVSVSVTGPGRRHGGLGAPAAAQCQQ